MSRRNRPPRRVVEPDVKYDSRLVARFCNKIMYGGKKSVAQKILYDAFDIIEQRAKKPPLEVFELAVKNVTPMIEVRPRRVGGATYQIPIEVRPERRQSLSLRWLVQSLSPEVWKVDGRESCRRVYGCGCRSRRGREEERRHPPDG